MTTASLKARYDTDTHGRGAAGTLALNGGDVKLRVSVTDVTLITGNLFLNGVSVSVEKPGSFIIDYNVPKRDVRFQFMNTVRVLDKQLNLTYTHARGDNRTALDGTLVLGSANKLSANYAFDSVNAKLKYSYVHGGLTTFEPCYDFAGNSWDFAVSQRVSDGDVLRASYQTSTRVLGLDWLKSSISNGSFKEYTLI